MWDGPHLKKSEETMEHLQQIRRLNALLLQVSGFDKRRLFYAQGDYGLWQCLKPCHARTYGNEEAVRCMYTKQRDTTELIPRCPVCGRPMTMNLRADDTFVQNAGWYEARERYADFLRRHAGRGWLGVGMNTPGIVKYPFLADESGKSAGSVYLYQ